MNPQQSQYRYMLSPSLLNCFSDYMNETGYEKDGVDIPFVTFENLIDRINRVELETTEAQQKGKDFEDVVVNFHESKVYGEGTTELEMLELFDIDVVKAVRQMLPKYYRKQVYIEVPVDDVLVYGYADVVGEGRVVDIKTSSRYDFPKFLTNHQNLYLLGLKDDGVKQMDYVLTNFRDIYTESYHIDNYSFTAQLNEIEQFKRFLEDHRALITDEKIFGNMAKHKIRQ